MSDQTKMNNGPASSPDVRDVVRQAIEEFVQSENRKAEPAYKAELLEEKRRREGLEARLNELIEENRKARAIAEEAERSSQIRSELQRLGVVKIDLAFRAVKDDISRTEDGQLSAKGAEGKSLAEFLAEFVQQNPELLPARIAGGTGAQAGLRNSAPTANPVEIELIRPGMSKDELDRVRQEISRLTSQALRGGL